jgi:hypothetical protein
MTKYLTARQKSEELGITTRGLAKTRHLYKHIKKSPRKFLYFAEDPREVIRPNIVSGSNGSVGSGTPKPPRQHRRRNVPYGEENYHKAPGGSGEKLKMLNQMRAKASLEGSVAPDELNSLTEAMALKIKDNHKEIIEEKRRRLQSELLAEDRRRQEQLKRRPGGLINLSTKGYPHSLLATGHNPDLVTSKSKWRYEPNKKYKYYW